MLCLVTYLAINGESLLLTFGEMDGLYVCRLISTMHFVSEATPINRITLFVMFQLIIQDQCD